MAMTEFLVRVRTTVPEDLSLEAWREVVAAERIRGAELRDAGVIAHIWRVPAAETIENVGVWHAEDQATLHAAIDSLPARPWMHVEVTPLERHPLSGD
jgi:muconolactone D-isomerase